MLQAQSYSFVKSISENALHIVPAQNGSFYTVSWQPNCPNDYMQIRYFNKMGDVLNTFKSPAYLASITSIDAITKPNNNLVLYLASGDINHLLYEFDSTGALIWNNNLQFTSPITKYTKLVLSPTGFYLLGNTYASFTADSSKAIITKLSATGKYQWSKYYKMNSTNPSNTHFNDMIYDNNKLLCVGRYFYCNAVSGWPPFRPIVSVLDTAGNLQQSYYYMVDSTAIIGGFDEYEFMKLDKTPAGNFYLVGNRAGNEHTLFKMNSSFNISWIKEKLSGKSTAMCAGYNEDVFIVPDGEFDNFVLQFDSTGQVISNHITKNSTPGFNLAFGHLINIERSDCGFLVSNNETMLAHTNKSMAYCIDSTSTSFGNYYAVNNYYRGNANLTTESVNTPNEYTMTSGYTVLSSTSTSLCNTTYTCGNTPNGTTAYHENEINIYPNPASSTIYIELPQNISAATLVMYDMHGKQVLQKDNVKTGIYTIHLSDYPTGFYVLRLSSNNNVWYKKISKIE